jgi:hypothetical protein
MAARVKGNITSISMVYSTWKSFVRGLDQDGIIVGGHILSPRFKFLSHFLLNH